MSVDRRLEFACGKSSDFNQNPSYKINGSQHQVYVRNTKDYWSKKAAYQLLTSTLLILRFVMRDEQWRVLTFVSLLFGVLEFRSFK